MHLTLSVLFSKIGVRQEMPFKPLELGEIEPLRLIQVGPRTKWVLPRLEAYTEMKEPKIQDMTQFKNLSLSYLFLIKVWVFHWSGRCIGFVDNKNRAFCQEKTVKAQAQANDTSMFRQPSTWGNNGPSELISVKWWQLLSLEI